MSRSVSMMVKCLRFGGMNKPRTRPAATRGVWAALLMLSLARAGYGDRFVAAANASTLPLRVLRVGANPVAIAIDSAEHQVLVANQGALDRNFHPRSRGTVTFLDERSGAIRRTVMVGIAPRAIAIDVRNHQAYVLNAGPLGLNGTPVGSGTATVLDTRTGRVIQSIPVGADPVALSIDSQRERVFIVNSQGTSPAQGQYPNGTLSVVDTPDHTVISTVPLGSGMQTIAEDRSAGRVFVASSGYPEPAPRAARGKVQMLNAATGSLLKTVPSPLACGVAIDEEAHRVFIISATDRYHGTLTLLDSTSGSHVRNVSLSPPACGQNAVVTDTTRGYAFVSTDTAYNQTTGAIVQAASHLGTIQHVQQTAGLPFIIGLDGTTGRLFVGTVVQSSQANGSLLRTTEVLALASATGKVTGTIQVGTTILALLAGAVDDKAARVYFIAQDVEDAQHPIPRTDVLELDTSHLQ